MARYVAEGVEVLVVTCTGGERGSVLNPKLDRPDVLGEHRRDPPRRDGPRPGRSSASTRPGWASSTPGCPRATRCRRCRRAASALVDPDEARDAAGRADARVPPARDDDVRRERRLPAPRPHHVPQGERGGVRRGRRPGALPRAGRAVAAAQALLQHRLHQGADASRCTRPCSRPGSSRRTGSGWSSWEDREDSGDRVTTRVECADYFAVRDDALRAHATQVDPDGFWFRVPLEVQRKAWPTEDFELVRSLVDSPVPEDDLFAGVRDGAGASRSVAWRRAGTTPRRPRSDPHADRRRRARGEQLR